MSHDVHFLERLARVAEGQVQLALSLYRDPALLKEVLSSASLPESSERVAISMADPVEGPFIVVTREGKFVTCLGAGMRTHDLPVVTRAKLDAVASRLEVLRERIDLARQVTENGQEPEMLPVWRKVVWESEAISREDVAMLAVWLPVMRPMLYDFMVRMSRPNRAVREKFAREKGDLDQRRKLMVDFARVIFAHAPIISLLLSDPAELSRLFVEGEEYLPTAVRFLIAEGTIDLLLRTRVATANGVARGGKPYVSILKHAPPVKVVTEFYLMAIGLAHEKLRAEIAKSLADDAALEALGTEEMHQRMLKYAQDSVWSSFAKGAPEFAAPYGSADKLPEHLALALLLNTGALTTDEDIEEALYPMLPMAVKLPPEDLFLPQELLEAHGKPDEESLCHFAERHVEALHVRRKREPVVTQAKPGRNEPCPCGSGKKYKKCCGRGDE